MNEQADKERKKSATQSRQTKKVPEMKTRTRKKKFHRIMETSNCQHYQSPKLISSGKKGIHNNSLQGRTFYAV